MRRSTPIRTVIHFLKKKDATRTKKTALSGGVIERYSPLLWALPLIDLLFELETSAVIFRERSPDIASALENITLLPSGNRRADAAMYPRIDSLPLSPSGPPPSERPARPSRPPLGPPCIARAPGRASRMRTASAQPESSACSTEHSKHADSGRTLHRCGPSLLRPNLDISRFGGAS